MKARTRGYVRRQLTWMRKLNADIIPTSARPPSPSPARSLGGCLDEEEGPSVKSSWQGPGKMPVLRLARSGNKYIVLHHEEVPFRSHARTVRLLCNRDFGIGSDGIW